MILHRDLQFFKLLSLRLAKEIIKNKQNPVRKATEIFFFASFKDGETDTRRGEVTCSRSLKRQRPLAGLLKADGSCSSERAPSELPSPASPLLAAGCCVIEQCVFPK